MEPGRVVVVQPFHRPVDGGPGGADDPQVALADELWALGFRRPGHARHSITPGLVCRTVKFCAFIFAGWVVGATLAVIGAVVASGRHERSIYFNE